jgi:DNA-directed RNA polymerase specialized sigma24 family protein
MEQRKPKGPGPRESQTEQLLASYYSQLLTWGAVLTRGDVSKAEDIVQEFCLYFTLTKPELDNVANLDGYLYTCLRHIYLSSMARSSREALHIISVAEFDSFEFAVSANYSGDPLQRQNDLRRICSYTVWRKESFKGASYFLLHFFHGYSRREIAELACLPLSAIYNKLKITRSEVKSYLNEPGKLRIVDRKLPPEPALSWSLSSTAELFNELRDVILDARLSDCLSEEDLLALYRTLTPSPINCSLLAHIVSCERCLAIIDNTFRRPTLSDREPLDGCGPSAASGDSSIPGLGDMRQRTMLQLVRKRWSAFHEHRPRTLSIAVNGKIVAFHDIQAEHSTLSARIEHPERAQFVEVFSEQDIRLALLSVGELPPGGSHIRTQRVTLSDSRWLELNLTFDGLGLNSQVAYFDPALSMESIEDSEDAPVALLQSTSDSVRPYQGIHPQGTSWAATACARILRAVTPYPAMAGAFALTIIVGVAGFLAYRHTTTPMDARGVLNQSIKIETASLQGQTEHQILSLEEAAADGRILQQGNVDMWRDGDGSRYVRRLFDSQHRLIGAKWRNKNGAYSSRERQGDKDASGTRHSLSIGGLWDQDLSAHAFSNMIGKEPQISAGGDGYALTTVDSVEGFPQLISATLVLDRHFLPAREILRVRVGSEIHELRFVQSGYERKPSSSVPNSIFDPEYELPSTHGPHSSLPQQDVLPGAAGSEVRLAQLQIAVLYRLSGLGSDTGEPIEVIRTPEGRIRVSGTVADSLLKQQIVSDLKALGDHQFLDLKLVSPNDVQGRLPGIQGATAEDTSVYEVNQGRPLVDGILRKYFQTKGVSADRLNSVTGQYSRDALQRAQHALQHAYALNRLGSALSATELKSIGLSSQRQWTEMVHKHATGLEGQLSSLRAQLAEIVQPSEELSDATPALVRIENPDQFNRAVDQLLHQTRNLNSDVGRLFTSNASVEKQPVQDSRLAATINAIPLRQAEEITRFAVELKTSGKSALDNREKSENGKGIQEQ